MAQPWKILDRVETAEGVLELRQRAEGDFLITVGSQVLMNSLAHRSEVALGTLACAPFKEAQAPQVLVGGLGMGYTLKAVLDNLPPGAQVLVAELNPVVVRWCQGPLASLTAGAVSDPRVTVEIGDVAAAIKRNARAGHRFHAIVLDLYRGPHAKTASSDPLYGTVAIENARAALHPGGIFAVWGEQYDEAFVRRLTSAGFEVRTERPGRGGLRHAVFLARLAPQRRSGP